MCTEEENDTLKWVEGLEEDSWIILKKERKRKKNRIVYINRVKTGARDKQKN